MLRILQVIKDNLARGPATVRLPDHVPTPPGFHGCVQLDPSKCLACGVCAYVCVSSAITGAEEDGGYRWAYEPGRCAFCARCADFCPGRALSMSGEATRPYTKVGALFVSRRVEFPPCPDCGAPRRPVTEALLGKAFAHLGPETRELARRCERCRRRLLQRGMAAALGAVLEEEER